jgi:hypothetical protein
MRDDETPWAALETAGAVELRGPLEASPLGGESCLYWELAVGTLWPEGWATILRSARASAPLEILIDGAPIGVLDPHALHPNLAPSLLRRSTGPDTDPPPLELSDLGPEDRPVDVAEYRLVPGRPYFVRVRVLESWLPPPEPGAPPERVSHRRLELSDAPFDADGRPGRPPCPSVLLSSF